RPSRRPRRRALHGRFLSSRPVRFQWPASQLCQYSIGTDKNAGPVGAAVKAALLLFPLLVSAADWPQFRGPNASGVAEECGLPIEFGPFKNIVWKTSLPAGHSSPVLAGQRIFLTAYEGDSLLTICLDRASGKIQWRREVKAARKEKLHKLNDRASPTPA